MSRMLTGVRNWLGDALGELLNLFESDEGEGDSIFVGYYAKGRYVADAEHIFALALLRKGVIPMHMIPMDDGRRVVCDPVMEAHCVSLRVNGGVRFSLGLTIDIDTAPVHAVRPLPEQLREVAGVHVGFPEREYLVRVGVYAQHGELVNEHLVRRPLAYCVVTQKTPIHHTCALPDLLHHIADGVRTREVCAGAVTRTASYLHAV